MKASMVIRITLVVSLSVCVVSQTPTQTPVPSENTDLGRKQDASVADDAHQVLKVGNGVTRPRVINHPDPEYSKRARKAKYQGTCLLWLIVDPDGKTRDIRVQRAIGMGLDEEAIKAVKKWTFEPALKDGKPVAVQINVEVSFRLY